MEKHDYTNSLGADGHRRKVYVDDLRGIFTSLKRLVYPALIIFFLVVPFIQSGGHRWFLIDIQHRIFYLFGFSFNAQDVYLVFFVVTGLAFSLFYITAVVGRVWCGWACPQTVFLDGWFRKIERFIEGNRASQIKLAQQSWGLGKTTKFVVKHTIFLLSAHAIALAFTSLFVTHADQIEVLTHGPASHPTMFTAVLIMTGILYGNYAWFREQTCLILCPYGRLQSILMDDDSLAIGYDKARGEPRGKKSETNRGACIDCGRCVAVCPTGIDIRNGMQMECIGCANCVDACDDIMTKIGQPKGLIRYDSLNGLEKKPKRILRPRIYVYSFLLLLGMFVSGFTLSKRSSFEANLIRAQTNPYTLQDGKIINQFDIHLFNKSEQTQTYVLTPRTNPELQFILPVSTTSLESLKDVHIPIFVQVNQNDFHADFEIYVDVKETNGQGVKVMSGHFLGPR